MKKSILLSIKPKYVNSILDGKKRFEFRKAIPNSKEVEEVYIYSSAPVQKIVGKFSLKNILHASPQEIWEKCSRYGGISEDDFFEYYRGREEAYSLSITDLEIFEEAICPYNTFKKFTAPQSFLYYDRLELAN